MPGEHVGPFGGDGVPVQFANAARLKAHGDSGNFFGDLKLVDVRFLGRACRTDTAGLVFHRIAERGERFVVLKSFAIVFCHAPIPPVNAYRIKRNDIILKRIELMNAVRTMQAIFLAVHTAQLQDPERTNEGGCFPTRDLLGDDVFD